jgi:hypothetical protein
MGKGLKYSLGVRALRKFAGKKIRPRSFVPFDEVNTVLLAWDEHQVSQPAEKKRIDKFIELLEAAGKKVTQVIYFHKRKPSKIPIPETDGAVHLSKNDFNAFGMPKTPQVKKLMAESYDYFINLNLDGRMPLKSIAGFTNATCRIGFNRSKSIEFYDVILGDPDNPKIEKFIEDLEYYLRKIG